VRTRLQQFGHGKRGPVGHRLQAQETGPPRGPKRISLSSSPRISGASSETLVPKSPSPEPRDPPAHRRPAWRSPAPACTSMTTSSVRLTCSRFTNYRICYRLRFRALTGRFCVWNRADSSTLAGDLQRILSTMRELDDRAHGDDFSPFLRFFEELCLYFCFSSVCVCNH